jgi:type I restriction enzyme S subunit
MNTKTQTQQFVFPPQWQLVDFGDAFEDVTGGNPKVMSEEFLPSGELPIVDQGQREIAGYTNDVALACRAARPTILFGDHTKIFKFVDFPFALGADGVKVLRPDERLNPRFAFYYLSQVSLPNDVGYSRHFKFLRRVSVPVPALEEQRRIAAVLDKADAIRRKRQEAIALTEQLLRSTFLEMFGDPVTNPKRWPLVELRAHVIGMDAGWSANGEPRERRENEWGVLKVSAVSSGWYRPEEHKAVTDLVEVSSLIVPKRGDLLFSRANTRELVAATCLVENDSTRLFLPDKLWRIRTDSRSLTAEYLRFILSDPKVRAALASLATGTSGSMLNVSKEKLAGFKVPLPPIEHQETFGRFFWRALALRSRAAHAALESDSLFHSLVQRAFSGQL